jgi:uncharacterized iron-regulated protein
MRPLIFILFLFIITAGFTGSKNAYEIFDGQGQKADFSSIVEQAKKVDVVLFGELHDNPISHWLQLELTRELLKDNRALVLGAEMFEADDQIPMNEYLAGLISEKTFKDEVKLWPNNKTDYRPLMELAKSSKVPFIATNVPRRYANLVYSKGIKALDSLDKEALRWIAPLPIAYDAELRCYKEIYEAAGGHGGQNLPQSQALKDATMAYFINKNIGKGRRFIHYNGAYHSNYHQGIEWYLKRHNKDLKILTISTMETDSSSLMPPTEKGIADFVIITPSSMTKTH